MNANSDRINDPIAESWPRKSEKKASDPFAIGGHSRDSGALFRVAPAVRFAERREPKGNRAVST